MAGFLYFLPDAPAALKGLDDWGLGHVGKPLTVRQARTKMGDGVLVAKADGASVEYAESQQTWRKIPDRFTKREAWLGYWNDQPPTEKDLAKTKQIAGQAVQLLGGEKWVVPRLRKFLDSDAATIHYVPTLPTLLDYNAEGQLIIGEVVPAYRAVWEMALRVGEQLAFGAAEDQEGRLTEAEVLEFAGPVLGLNYHASIFELIVLGVLGIDEGREVVRVALDMKGFEGRLKNLLGRSVLSGTNLESGGELA